MSGNFFKQVAQLWSLFPEIHFLQVKIRSEGKIVGVILTEHHAIKAQWASRDTDTRIL
jgi:hypothetical protein